MTITTFDQLTEEDYKRKRYELIKAVEGEESTAYYDNGHMAAMLDNHISNVELVGQTHPGDWGGPLQQARSAVNAFLATSG